jgi:hypothetical protein
MFWTKKLKCWHAQTSLMEAYPRADATLCYVLACHTYKDKTRHEKVATNTLNYFEHL